MVVFGKTRLPKQKLCIDAASAEWHLWQLLPASFNHAGPAVGPCCLYSY